MRNPQTPNPQRQRSTGWFIVSLLVLGVVILLGWLGINREPSGLPTETTTTEDTEVDVIPGDAAEVKDVDVFIGTTDAVGVRNAEDVLAEDTGAVLGQVVKVRGEVNDVITDGALLIDSDGAVGGDEILVIYSSDTMQPGAVTSGQEAVVEGKVVQLTIEELKNKLGDKYVAERIDTFANVPVIDATALAH